MKLKALAGAMLLSTCVFANETPITGNVESKCVITTDTPGIYGNPSPNLLSTNAADGGIEPVIRFDVISAGYYKAAIATPVDFSISPSLSDTVTWEGAVSVGEVSDAQMSAYDSEMRLYNNVSEVDLTVPGSVWFKVESSAQYGYDKSFPAGNYNAIVTAECIAQ
jgi:hypothetical protein